MQHVNIDPAVRASGLRTVHFSLPSFGGVNNRNVQQI